MINHFLWLIQIAAVDHDGEAQGLTKTLKIDFRKLLPLGQDQERVGALRGFKEIPSITEIFGRRQDRLSEFHRRRVIRRD